MKEVESEIWLGKIWLNFIEFSKGFEEIFGWKVIFPCLFREFRMIFGGFFLKIRDFFRLSVNFSDLSVTF